MSPRLATGSTMTPHEAAADWLLREEAGRLSPTDLARMDDWLAADPANGAALDDVRLAMTAIAGNAADPELMAMRTSALEARGDGGWGWRQVAASLAVVALMAGAGWLALGPAGAARLPSPGQVPARTARVDPDTALYRTAVGERSAITLPDGSIATLDTDSVLRVAYTGAERGVRLLRGQALFDVAKHRPIPFQVYAGDRRITAVGTRFNVRLDETSGATRVRVALLEGVVKVTATPGASAPAGAPVEAVTMAAGEVLEAAPSTPVRVAAANTDQVASWRAGVLTFDDAPLGQAVGEMNRYTLRPIVLADPRLASLRVSGVFRTGDPEHFAETMAEVFPIRVDHQGDGSPVLAPRG